MNNEEKILEMLQKLTGEVGDMCGEMNEMRGEMNEMRGEIRTIDKRLANVEQKVDYLDQNLMKVQMNQENRIIPNIKLLAEGHETLHQQIENISEIQKVKAEASVLKTAVSDLNRRVEKLEEASA